MFVSLFMALKELLERDSEINYLIEEIQEIRGEAMQRVYPLARSILKRKKEVVVSEGYAVKTISDMSRRGRPRFRKNEKEGVITYGAKGTEEHYMRCDTCKLYIRNDAINEEEFGDDNLNSHELGVHDSGIKYSCPICNLSMGEKITFFVAVD